VFVERLWRSVKYEEVYLNEYASVSEGTKSLGKYFRFYNEKRPHQALGYRTPEEIWKGVDLGDPAALCSRVRRWRWDEHSPTGQIFPQARHNESGFLTNSLVLSV
jgi:hypothetical protein